jgi:signal transduction histidine kinase
MNSVTGIFLIFIALATLVLLLAYALVRRSRLKTGQVWLPLVMLVGGLGVGSLLLPPFQVAGITHAQVVVLAHMAALTVFSGLIARDLTEKQWRVFVGGGVFWSVVVLATSFITPPTYGVEGWITGAFASMGVAELLVLAGFVVLSVGLLVVAFYVFYVTLLPEVSNRALFWVFNVTLMMIGFALTVSGAETLIALGVGTMTLSYLATTYSQISYRVFDIRNVLGLVLRLVAMITSSALAIFAALYVLDRLQLSNPVERTLLAGTLAIVIAALYTPFRELVNVIIDTFIVGRKTDAVEATKRYSQEVSRALEINDLVELSTRTLNRVLRVKRSGLLLVRNTEDNRIDLGVVRGGAFSTTNDTSVLISVQSPVYRHIVQKQQPISQFDIEFNPDFADASDAERDFFRSLEMSAYAPIVLDNALIGLLACGAKLNDAPIYQHDLELLVALANQTGVALRNTHLVADLRNLNQNMQSLNQNLGETNDRMSKLDSVKTDFITIASHELRTPLAQVRGYTDIIDALNDQGMLDQDQTRGLVNNLRKATERMEELIAAMLDVSQLDVNAMDLRFTQTSPESVLRMAIEPLTDPIKQRRLTLSARGLRGLPQIEADMQRLVQAFRNIITNAIKFTPDGGRIDITANFHEAEDETVAAYILIAVADSGIGLGQEDTKLIFNKFYRASDPGLHSTGTYKFMGAGPGLGLTIAKGVIDGHGGRIWVESPGHNPEAMPGSTFYVQLPLVPPENARRVLPFEKKEQTQSKPVNLTQPDTNRKLETTETPAVNAP